jgi:hypothetical protein
VVDGFVCDGAGDRAPYSRCEGGPAWLGRVRRIATRGDPYGDCRLWRGSVTVSTWATERPAYRTIQERASIGRRRSAPGPDPTRVGGQAVGGRGSGCYGGRGPVWSSSDASRQPNTTAFVASMSLS